MENEIKYEDRQLTCRDCGDQFKFSARDQAFFAAQGYADPFRCYPCRRAKQENRENPNVVKV